MILEEVKKGPGFSYLCICDFCGREFYRHKSQVYRKNQKTFCCVKHRYEFQNKNSYKYYHNLKEGGEIMEDNNRDCMHDCIMWNPYNMVYQCHRCGQVFVKKEGENDKNII